MIRVIFAFLLSVHGLIHVLGFVKEFGLARVDGLSGQTTLALSDNWHKPVGLLWLAACVLFIGAAVGYLAKKEWWMMVAFAAVILSQALLILYWQDAKFGTLANVLILAGILLSYAHWNFQAKVKQELELFLPKQSQETTLVTADMLSELPPVVQKWLIRSKVVGKELTQQVYLKQLGQMRTKPDGAWMPVRAEEFFTVHNPGFFWVADVTAAPYLHLYGRDKYENGRGHMLIKLLSFFPVANATGNQIDQGTLLRYLGEIVWFPSAALSKYITWQQLDATSAKATMQYGGVSASGIFTFTPEGDILRVEADRYYDRKEGATLEKWVVTTEDGTYKDFEGIRIPAKSQVTWKLKEGDFTWFKLEIEEVDYNPDTRPEELVLTH
ncbi:hypothetical protein Q0590_10670 [Rhodocytophaga aerolata]|uniref:Uncharacterized protein n=1 Tax=Rhodocytophaga aerolata TaxID=455078 RepID=A0ABT8R3N7_9BACT|nr:DUF6544 family protein [Rhodocytophaga aerolata]MDO1446717.1 hypothetical protein [Rhodocytophaga aerolata]